MLVSEPTITPDYVSALSLPHAVPEDSPQTNAIPDQPPVPMFVAQTMR
jgi:hypothetical protein